MGDWTKTLLVRSGQESRPKVRAALEHLAEQDAYVPALPGEPADREMTIGDAGGAWTVVTDRAFFDEDHQLRATATALHAVLEATILTCVLADGDSTELTLYDRGERIATVARGVSATVVQKGQWRRALGRGVSLQHFFDELTRLRDQGDTIDELARLLGCSGNALRSGDPAIGEVERLRFRLRKRPRWETPADGPGRLEPFANRQTRSPTTLRVGQRHESSFGGRNRGGAFSGLRIEISGDAIARGLLVPTVVRVEFAWVRGAGPVGRRRVELPATEALASPRVIVMPDISISGGRVELPLDLEIGEAAIDARHAGNLSVFVDAVARTPGTGTLRIACFPSEAGRAAGLFDEEVITVQPAAWRPLRASLHGHTPALDDLASDRVFSAIVVYACARDVAAEHARELFDIVFASRDSLVGTVATRRG